MNQYPILERTCWVKGCGAKHKSPSGYCQDHAHKADTAFRLTAVPHHEIRYLGHDAHYTKGK